MLFRYDLIIMMQMSLFRAVGSLWINRLHKLHNNIIHLLHPTLLCFSATVSITLSCGKIEAENRGMLLFKMPVCLAQLYSKR